MTRYTNVGRKRKYLESEKEIADKDAAKKSRLVEDEGQTTLASTSKAAESSEIKNAYKNRDKIRKKEALRTAASEKRRLQRLEERLANTTCFACRQKGHAAKSCPNARVEANEKGKGSVQHGICYRCGSNKHSLSRCKKPENPDNPLPFASCFVCSGKGHISSSCPKNENKGIYPNGGSCKLCGETSHLARNCPTRKQDNTVTQIRFGTGEGAGADEDDFHTFKRINNELDLQDNFEAKAKRKTDLKVGVMSQKVVHSRPPTVRKVVNF